MKKCANFLLSILFTRKVFSYEKIFELYTQEQSVVAGISFSKNPFTYLLPYKKYIREAFWSLKFKNNRSVAVLFGKLMYETLPEQIIQWEQFENFNNPILATVPSSKQTLHKRGYNQNDLIVRSFLRHGGDKFIEYKPRIIRKTKNIPKQSRTKSKQERLINPKGAFAVANAPLIKNRNIILFDDILTTGATTQEIKKLLHKAGVIQVKIVVIAH